MVKNLIAKFRANGSVLEKKTKNMHILTEELPNEVVARSEASPKKSLRLFALQCGISKSTANVEAKVLKIKPYRRRVFYQLSSPDAEESINYCRRLQQSACDRLVDPDFVFDTGEP
jgi:hypothetical protein